MTGQTGADSTRQIHGTSMVRISDWASASVFHQGPRLRTATQGRMYGSNLYPVVLQCKKALGNRRRPCMALSPDRFALDVLLIPIREDLKLVSGLTAAVVLTDCEGRRTDRGQPSVGPSSGASPALVVRRSKS